MKALDLTGSIFGRLTVIEFARKTRTADGGESKRKWLCKCECGSVVEVSVSALRLGRTKSCGCLFKESLIKRNQDSVKHGMSKSREYSAWKGAKSRCYDEASEFWFDYGGRGISMCESWLEENGQGFLNFYNDLGPSNGLTLERVNVNLGYSKENCIWADKYQQAYNKRRKRTNTSGRTGVNIRSDGKWEASITIKSCRYYLGTYVEFSDAVKAREAAEVKYHGTIKEE